VTGKILIVFSLQGFQKNRIRPPRRPISLLTCGYVRVLRSRQQLFVSCFFFVVRLGLFLPILIRAPPSFFLPNPHRFCSRPWSSSSPERGLSLNVGGISCSSTVLNLWRVSFLCLCRKTSRSRRCSTTCDAAVRASPPRWRSSASNSSDLTSWKRSRYANPRPCFTRSYCPVCSRISVVSI
jgi:hypothetical protein